MYITLVSPLSIRECISRLQTIEQQIYVVPHDGIIQIQCKVRGNSFTLKKTIHKDVPFMHGDLEESHDGTVIRYFMQIDSSKQQFDNVWLSGVLILGSCILLGIFVEVTTNGFSKSSFEALLGLLAIPGFYYLNKYLGVRRSEVDKKYLLKFLQETLEAKPRLP